MLVKKILKYRLTMSQHNKYNQLSLSSILDLCQDIAGIHANDIGCGYEDFKKRNLAWFIVSNKVIINNLNKLTDEVIVETWPHQAGRLYCLRDYLIKNSDGQELAR